MWKHKLTSLKSPWKHKTVLVLLFVAVVNLVAFFFVWRLDGFVHSDLYSYGLVFSFDWAMKYWDYNWMVIVFLVGATVLSAVSMIPHYLRSGIPGRSVKYAALLLPTLALICQTVAIVNLDQIDNLVWSGLYAYGVQSNIDWSATYNPISMPALGLMVVGLFGLIITAIAALNIIKIEIVYEDENLDTETTEKTAEPEKARLEEAGELLAREEAADLIAPIGPPPKLAESTREPAKEEKPETTKEESQERKIVKKRRRRRKRRKRRGTRAAAKAT